MYDSTYTQGYCHANNLDSSLATRNASHNPAMAGTYNPRSLLPASQTLKEQQAREPTRRKVDMARLRDRSWIGNRSVSFSELERKPLREGLQNNYDLRDHIPQYRKARHVRPNPDLTNLGIRNTGPIHSSKAEKFWNQSAMQHDTFTEFDARPLGQLEGGLEAGKAHTRSREYARTLPARAGMQLEQHT